MALSLASLSLGVPALHETRAQWSEYKTMFNKTYTVEEEETRFAAFLGNLAHIERRNTEEGPDGATPNHATSRS